MNMGVQIEIFKFSNLGLFRTFWKLGFLRRKQPSSGKLGGNLLPPFPINKRREAVPNISNPLGYAFQLFWVKKFVSMNGKRKE